VAARVETSYPWDETIRVVFDAPTTRVAQFRIPSWARAATIAIDGGSAVEAAPGYAEAPVGTTSVELVIPVGAEFVRAKPRADGARGTFAL
ncbi:glycoside hydrolase family 127 protein, partial [Bacillus sp. SIMBA_161]